MFIAALCRGAENRLEPLSPHRLIWKGRRSAALSDRMSAAMNHLDVGSFAGLWRRRSRRRRDPLLRVIGWDLLVTTLGFALAVTAVLLAAQGLSID
jgi:hypothetical protein